MFNSYDFFCCLGTRDLAVSGSEYFALNEYTCVSHLFFSLHSSGRMLVSPDGDLL